MREKRGVEGKTERQRKRQTDTKKDIRWDEEREFGSWDK